MISIFDKIMDLKKFRQCNKLTQTELGEYLGIKKSFVSLIETGRVKISEEKFNKLLNNTKGWDVSMLTGEGSIINNGGDAVVNIGRGVAKPSTESTRMAVLEKENEMLREQLKDKEAQIDFLRELVKKN